jgi:hypothetical protein
VCAHVARTQIELLLAGGAGQKAVARKFSISKDSVHRHWHSHVSDARKATLILGPVQKEALAARVAEEAGSVIDHHRITRSGLYDLFSAALEAGDRTAGAMLAGRLTEVNSAIGRLTGELAASPLISNTVVNNNVTAVFESPRFLQFERALLALANEHPELHPRLLAIIKLLDDEDPAAQRPALEHQVVPEAASSGV